MERTAFFLRVYEMVDAIPYGKVATYGQIAWMLGAPKRSRQVGQALRYAPPGLPCHRVVNHCGRLAPNWPEQRVRLEAEGVCFQANGCVDLSRSRWK